MSRRIDIELTSAREDGTWTWRAAGAKQPRGVVDSGLLYEGARAGDIVRAEADFEIEGITIISVVPPKEKRAEAERLEIIGPQQRETPGVTSSLVPKREREGDRRGPRRDDRGERGERGDRGGRPGRPPRERPGQEGAGRPPRERTRERTEGRGGPRPGRPGPERAAPEPRPKEKRLSPGNTHRAAALEALPPEQRPVAEQVLRGGIPAVRSALEQESAKAREEGRPEVNPDAILTLAEELLPRMKAAEWHDRAEAAAKSVDDISLRDLRAVVAGSDAVARDDETRMLASTLREALERRVAAQRDEWVGEITRCLDDGRLVRALRVSARPPDPSSRFPSDLANRLSDAASAAMAPDITPDRWATLLDAVAGSPVRRSVKPVGLPAEPGEPLLQAARQQSGRVPALAAMLGIDMPPPPGPPASMRGRHGGGRPGRPGAPPRPKQTGGARPPRPPQGQPTQARRPEAQTTQTGPPEGPSTQAGPTEGPSTQGASAVPAAEEPTEVGALAAPDPATENPPAGPASEYPPADTVPSPAHAVSPISEPDSPAEAVAAQLLREQAPDEDGAPAPEAPPEG